MSIRNTLILLALLLTIGPVVAAQGQARPTEVPPLAELSGFSPPTIGQVDKGEKRSLSLPQALRQLERHYGINLLYETPTVAEIEVAIPTLQQATGEVALNDLVADHGLVVRRLDERTFVIRPAVREGISRMPIPHSEPTSTLGPVTPIVRKLLVTITGSVRGEDGIPLIGVTVIEVGSNRGTVTDVEGDFTIEVENAEAALTFSYTGYATQTIALAGRRDLSVQLAPDAATLTEVVVLGYNETTQRDLTGSVSTLRDEVLQERPIQSVEQALAGNAAGVLVTQADGAPGGGINVQIRGINSISGNAQPLYVVDGVPIQGGDVGFGGTRGAQGNADGGLNPLATINPNDIASISVLKDASATAVYGSRASNGVVVITTKRGGNREAAVNFDIYAGVRNLINPYELAGARLAAEAVNADLSFRGRDPLYSEEDLARFERDGAFDWVDAISRQGVVQNYQLGVSGGNETTQYYLSGNFNDDKGIIDKSGFRRYGIRLNLDQEIGIFRFGTSLTYNRSRTDNVPAGGGFDSGGGTIGRALFAPPMYSPYREDGSYDERDMWGRDRRVLNPVQALEESEDRLLSDRLIGNLYAQIDFTDRLRFRSTIGGDLNLLRRSSYESPNSSYRQAGAALNGLAVIANSDRYFYINTNQLDYTLDSDDHELVLTGIHEWQLTRSENGGARATDLVSPIFTFNNIGASNESFGPPTVYSFIGDNTLLSYVGRANYNFRDRYLVTLSGRTDGSSLLAPDNRWQFFPSAAVGWRVSEEPFFQRLNEGGKLSSLKLRLSWGRTGNQNAGRYQYLSLLALNGGRLLQGDYNPLTGVEISNSLPNTDLGWETTTQTNIGLDLGLLQDRIALTADYFVANIDNLILNLDPALSSGFGTTVGNFGAMQNRGLELAASAQILRGKVNWRVGANYSRIRNEVNDLFTNDIIFGPNIFASGTTPGNAVIVGQPVGVIYGHRFFGDGLTNSQDELDAYLEHTNGSPPNQAQLGGFMYRDENGDGTVNDQDRVVLGSALPDYSYGFTTSVSYAGFTLDAFIRGSVGNEAVNLLRIRLENTSTFENKTRERLLGAWTPETAETATYPAIGGGIGDLRLDRRITEGLVEDASFLRLQKLSLSYEVLIGANALLRRLKVYAAADNVFTVTDYSGFNPEVNAFNDNNINRGIDLGNYPLSRTLMLGLNASF